ncbi:zinc ABC transporter substrate-binding protein [Paracoccus sp. Z330]|uniref:High-affinity zinc uptake system protein ZnuA n=1 Tax=Paracoccus onchidii TaxID=3017813 RepID=A0ABT4ZBH1_9RHOB|nr:zinc ABC transporter substrate-binding protein [Paracoccus onchidii]MDB6176071.1 zinc ABC transporter substrate-binding protein [Paracoccus onchidii]
MHAHLSVAAFAACLATPTLAAPPTVVADTAVTASFVAQVMGDLGQPSVLIPSGASLHHYQMRPSDARKLQSADTVIWTGPELTPWLERAVSGVTASQLQLTHVPGTHLQGFAGDAHDPAHDDHAHEEHDEHGHAAHDHDHDHDHEGHSHDEHEHEAHAEHDGHDHDHSGTDPHAWLTPENGPVWLAAIAQELSRLDPENADAYKANAEAAATRLSDLDAELNAELAPISDQSFVVFHDAYGYFTTHFGLRPAIAVSLGDATSPSAARLSEIRERIADTGVNCAFPEAGHDPKLIETAIENSGTKLGAALDPAGTELEGGPDFYATLMRNLARTLTDCMGES